ncbi:hypothetical protein D3C71_1275550 [compost metagenome]
MNVARGIADHRLDPRRECRLRQAQRCARVPVLRPKMGVIASECFKGFKQRGSLRHVKRGTFPVTQ